MKPQMMKEVAQLKHRAEGLNFFGQTPEKKPWQAQLTESLKGVMENADDQAAGKALCDLHRGAFEGDRDSINQLNALRIVTVQNYMIPRLNFGRFFEINLLGPSEAPSYVNETKQEFTVGYVGQDGAPKRTKVIKPRDVVGVDLKDMWTSEAEWTTSDIYTGDVSDAAKATFDLSFDGANKLDGLLYDLLVSASTGAFGSFDFTNANKAKRTLNLNSRIRTAALPTTNDISIPSISGATVFGESTLRAIVKYSSSFGGAQADGPILPTGEIIIPGDEVDGIMSSLTISTTATSAASKQLLEKGYFELELLGVNWKFIPDLTIPAGKCFPVFNKPVGQLWLKPSRNRVIEKVDEEHNLATRKQCICFGAVIPKPWTVRTARIAYHT